MPPDLYANLDAILADIRRGKVRREYREPLIEHLERTVRASAGRAGSGPVNSKQNSQRRRDAVQLAAQQLAKERPGLTGRERTYLIRQRAHALLNKDREGKKPLAKPSRRLVSDVLRAEKRIALFGTESTRARRYHKSMLSTHATT